MREDVANELAEVINEFGPKVFEDFDQVCVILRSSARILLMAHRCAFSYHPRPLPHRPVSPASGGERAPRVVWTHKAISSHILWCAICSLFHLRPTDLTSPQTWLDERLFGWSRSANRGTSAWAGGGTRSQEISRSATPDLSDEEDEPDYDNLIVPSAEGSTLASNPRSQRSSYADITRLRRTSSAANTHALGFTPTSPTANATGEHSADLDGLHFRGQGRARKASLSDGVPVEIIGQADRAEPFTEMTQDLNSEMRKRKSSQDRA